jgi:hypothetical protein
MHTSEAKFLQQLEQKAREERRIVSSQLMPAWARGLGEWLVVNPWRVVIPIAGIVYYLLRITLGTRFRELILGIFGGF